MEDILLLILPIAAVLFAQKAKDNAAGSETPPETAPETSTSMLTPSVTPEVVPGTLENSQEQAVAVDITPANTPLAIDVNSSAYINWFQSLKMNVFRTLQTFGTAQSDIDDTLRFINEHSLDVFFVDNIKNIMAQMGTKYSITESYLGSVYSMAENRPAS